MLTNNSQRGFYLIEAIVVMSVAISLMSLGSRYITDSAERSVNQVTAQQLKQVTRAAQQYVQDHYQAFNDNPDNPLTWQTLVDQRYLPDKVSKHNHYGHNYQFEVKNADRQLQLILTTQGGQAIREASLRQIAALAGSSAGYATTLHKNKIVGNQEGWFLEGVPLPTGHLASFTVINEKEIMDAANFLRRTKFKDHEAYNRMETDLLMDANTIHLVKDNDVVELNTAKLLFSNIKGKSIGIFNSYYPSMEIQDHTFPDDSSEMTLNSANLKFNRGNGKGKGKSIGILNSGYPSIEIQDHTLPNGSNEMTLNSADLKFSKGKGKRNIHIGVDEPKIFIEKKVGDQYYRSLMPKFSTDNLTLGSDGIKTGKYPLRFLGNIILENNDELFSAIHNTFIKVPYINIKYITPNRGHWGNATNICNAKENEGALFLVGWRDGPSRELSICANGQARQLGWWD